MAKKESKSEERELTPRDIARRTLENKVFQGILGSNNVRSNPFLYGQLGAQGGETSYANAMSSPDAQKARSELYQKSKAKGDQLGVYGEPSIGNYEVSTDIIQQLEEEKQRLSLADLGEIVKGVASGFKFDVPEALKDYIPLELYQKAASSGKEDIREALSEEEIDALATYERVLSPAYNRGAALRAAQSGYFADITPIANQISEKYAPKEQTRH